MAQGIKEPGNSVVADDQDDISPPHIEGFAIISDEAPADDAWMDYEIERIPPDLDKFPDLLDLLLEGDEPEDGIDGDVDADITVMPEVYNFMPGINVEIKDIEPNSGLSYSNSAAWHNDMYNRHATGSDGSYAGLSGPTSVMTRVEVANKRTEELRERLRLYNLLNNLDDQVQEIADRVERYLKELAGLNKNIEDVCRRRDYVVQSREAVEHMSNDQTLADFYREHYAGKVMNADGTGLLDAMQHPVKIDGDMVYSDASGFYRLELQENGDAVLDANTGMPVRHYYTDPHQTAEITRQITHEHRLTGEFTPQSRDMLNIRYQELIQTDPQKTPPKLKGYIDTVNPHAADGTTGEPIGAAMTMGTFKAICDDTICRLVDEEEMLVERRETVERQLEQEYKKYEALEDQQGPLPELPRHENHGNAAAADTSINTAEAIAFANAETVKAGETAVADTDQVNTTAIAQGPAPAFDDGKMPEAIANLIEGGSVDAELLTYALADLSADDQARLVQKLEQQGITITNPGTSAVSPTVLAYAEPAKPEIFGGPGVRQDIAATAQNLPVTEIQPISIASQQLEDEPSKGPNLQLAFAEAATPKLPEPAPEPQNPAPIQNPGMGLVA